MLSVRDNADWLGGSCVEIFRDAPTLKAEEHVLKTGQGHGLFFAPQAVWLDLVDAWARGRS